MAAEKWKLAPDATSGKTAAARALIGQRVSIATWPGVTGELQSVSDGGLAFLVNVSAATPGGAGTHSCACSNIAKAS